MKQEDRLTKKGVIVENDDEEIKSIPTSIFALTYNYLAAYEDTGLSPEEIKTMQAEFNINHELLDQYELDCTDLVVVEKNKQIAVLKAETERLKIALQNACNTIKSANAYIFDEPYPSDINYYLGGNADD